MTYTIELSPTARRQIRGLPQEIRRRVAPVVDGLAADPRPPGAIRLRGKGDAYRVRVGAYRIVYEIQDDCMLVRVLAVAHRREAYRRMP